MEAFNIQNEVQSNIIAALVYGIIFMVLLTTGLLLFFHYSRRKIVQKEIEKAQLKVKHQEHILQSTISTQEIERRRIAQDMHDAISSKLNIVSLTTNLLLDDNRLEKDQLSSLEHILGVTTNTLESSRRIAHKLLPPILDKFGLKVALEELFDEYAKSTQLHIIHNVDNISEISKPNELHIFRIVQELINNSTKHGHSTIIKVALHKIESGFELIFEDNGKGFNKNISQQKTGIGLEGIKSRAAILQSNFEIESTINKGSIFRITTY